MAKEIGTVEEAETYGKEKSFWLQMIRNERMKEI